jgi:hypothetical protein
MKRIRIEQPQARREPPWLRSSRPTRGTQTYSGPRHSAAPPIPISR